MQIRKKPHQGEDNEEKTRDRGLKRRWLWRGLVGAVAALVGATVLQRPEQARAFTTDDFFQATGPSYYGFVTTTGRHQVGVWALGDLQGVFGFSPDLIGVYGVATNFGPGIGAAGVGGTSNGHVGVVGTSFTNDGVLGLSGGVQGPFAGPAGVYGTSQDRPGVVGTSTNNTGIYGTSTNGYAGQFDGTTLVNGDLIVLGAKSAAVPHPDGSLRRLYSLESPESWLEDFGRGALAAGHAQVKLDPGFAATVRTDDYLVFITPKGDTKGVYVSNQGATGFEVHENQGGMSSVEFDYRIVAKRKDIARPRLEPVKVPEKMKPIHSD